MHDLLTDIYCHTMCFPSQVVFYFVLLMVVMGVAGNEVMASSAQEILQDQATKINQVRLERIWHEVVVGNILRICRIFFSFSIFLIF